MAKNKKQKLGNANAYQAEFASDANAVSNATSKTAQKNNQSNR
ncbi:hypothetical protein ACFPPD_08175 [Cohnella suwonensis]|uniref:Small, acid-soluble spore protein gamma-type n=1 Tax=Cohnella suwonensis TaxID=696072 RepID=A0ABW0LV47_9BACL